MGKRRMAVRLAQAAVVAAGCACLIGGTPKFIRNALGGGNGSSPAKPAQPQQPQQEQPTGGPLPEALVKKLKRATVAVVTGPSTSASAFCVNAAGLFLTARRVVDAAHAPIGKTVTLVIDPGEPTQRKVTARVIRLAEFVALLQAEDDDAHGPAPFTALELNNGNLTGTWNVTIAGVPSSAVKDAPLPAATSTAAQCWFYYKPAGYLRNIHLHDTVPAGGQGGPVVGDAHGRVIGVVHPDEAGLDKLASPTAEFHLLAPSPVIAVRVTPGPEDGDKGDRTFAAAVFTAHGWLKAAKATLTVGTGKAAVKTQMSEVANGAFRITAAAAPGTAYTVSVTDGPSSLGDFHGKVGGGPTTKPTTAAATAAPAARPAVK